MSKVLGISKNNVEVFDHPESHLHFDGDLLADANVKRILMCNDVDIERHFDNATTIDRKKMTSWLIDGASYFTWHVLLGTKKMETSFL